MTTAALDDAEESALEKGDDERSDAGDDVPDENLLQLLEYDEIPKEVNTATLNKLQLPQDLVEAAQETWQAFLNLYDSKIAAGEAIFMAIFDAGPSLQATFKSPKATTAERFVKGFGEVVKNAGSKGKLMNCIQQLGFRHLEFDITVQKVDTFREALVDLLELELKTLSAKGRYAMALLMNYIGGALIFIKSECQPRVGLIQSTWQVAKLGVQGQAKKEKEERQNTKPEESKKRASIVKKQEEQDDSPISNVAAETQPSKFDNVEDVPTNFAEMFNFNVSAMGFGLSEPWMRMVLLQLDDLVMHVTNTTRIKEECEKLALFLSKHQGPILLSEVRSVALSSLKSFVSAWDEEHEMAWTWFWTNVERLLSELDGKLQVQEQKLANFMETSAKRILEHVVQNIHLKFFEIAPAGQEFFKESKTRMYHIAERTLELTLLIHREPSETIDGLSALGLRHVGMSIPVEFFPPFVQAAVEAMQEVTSDEMVITAFRWSVTLIGKILARTVTEGSTLVMRAVTLDDAMAIHKAVSLTPRRERASQLLYVTVGTHSISPLLWAIENAYLTAADAILKDLLTIRADRHAYYYGCDALFARHPEIIQLLISRARPLMPTLLDGLIWRSRYAVEGKRRVNYYVKHLIEDREGNFNNALKWVVQSRDTELVRHPTFELVSDTVWEGLVLRAFALDLLISLCFLIVFVTAQSFLQHTNSGNPETAIRTTIFGCRLLVYLGNIPLLLAYHVLHIRANYREGKTTRMLWCLRSPEYLQKVSNLYRMGLLICLSLMCVMDPIFWCLSESNGDLFTQKCPTATAFRDAFSVMSMLTMLFYWLILSGFAGLSMRVSAYCLLCGQVIGELGLFVVSMAFLILTFASSLSALEHGSWAFTGLPRAALSLWELSLGMVSSSQLQSLGDDLTLLLALSAFSTLVLIFLLSLLVAQLNQASEQRYDEMFGFARLHRCDSVVALIEMTSKKKWTNFQETLHFAERLEFNAGDVGIAGGLQVLEPAVNHPTAAESIKRYGGTTSSEMPWPEEKAFGNEDPFEELERDMLDVMKDGTRLYRKALESRSKSKHSTLESATASASIAATSIVNSFVEMS